MNLILYNSNEESFETLGIGVLSDFSTDPIITEVLKGEYILEFDYIKNGKYCEYLLEQNIIKALGQPFRIVSVNPSNSGYKVLAKHIYYDLKSNFLEDVAPTNKTAQEALKWILERTLFKNQFKVTGDCVELASSRYVRTTPYDAFFSLDNSILSKYGGEPEFDNFNIILHQRRGRDSGVEIREGKNLSGIKICKDFSSIVTKICPVGSNGLLLPEKYVDSPLINKYYAPKTEKIEFTDIGVTEDVTEEEACELLRKSCQKLFDNGLDKPIISVSVDFIELSKTKEYLKYQNLETLELGDTLRVYVPSLNQDYDIRVIKIVKNALTGRITNLELGNEIPSLITYQTAKNNAIANNIKKSHQSALSEARDDLTKFVNHPYNGHLIISKETGELFILDTTDISTAKEIWKFGLGGWGFSSSGIDGPYESGLTKDGHFIADWITTGTMSAERIEGLSELILTVKNINKEIDPIKTATGNPIEVTDVGEYLLESIGVDGKSEQETRSGKNLWKLPKTQTLNGVTLTNNGDGTITLNGTATANADFYAEDNSSNYTNGEKYYISSNINKSDVTLLIANYNGNTYANTMINSNQTMPFTMNTTNDKVRLIVRVLSGKTFNNTKLQIQLEKGSTETDFEPYVGREPSPSPDFPSEIKTVKGIRNLINDSLLNNGYTISGVDGSISYDASYLNNRFASEQYIKVYNGMKLFSNYQIVNYGKYDNNKNFISRVATNSATTINIDFDGYIRIGFINVNDTNLKGKCMVCEKYLPNNYIPYGSWLEQKTIGKNRFNKDKITTGKYLDIDGSVKNGTTTYCISDKIYLEKGDYVLSGNTGKGYNLCIYNDSGFVSRVPIIQANIDIKFTINENNMYIVSTLLTVDIDNIQLEKGIKSTPYEEYKENNSLIDMNIYDEEGNITGYHEFCSIGDTKDTFKDGVLTQNIPTLILTGNENFNVWVNQGSYTAVLNLNAKYYESNLTIPDAKCTHFEIDGRLNVYNGTSDNIFSINNTTIYIRCNKYKTLTEFKSFLKQQYDNGTPVTVYYVLAEPKTYKLSYEPLKLFKGYNYITLNDDLNPIMNIEYLTDSKLNAEFTTKSEFNISNNSIRESVSAEIKELDKKTEASLELKVNEKDMMSQINAKADEINFESDKMTIKCSDFELKNGKIKATGGTIGEWKLDGKGNLYSDYGNYRIYLQNAKVAGGDTWVLSSQIKNSAGNYSGAFILYANGDIESYKRIISHNSIFSDGNIVCGQIEVCNPFPYIDFHWNTTPNNYTDDYSTRIIEREYGVISFLNASGWANCRGGSWTNSSSRLVKKNIEEISEDEAKALLDLKAVSFDYKNGVTNNQRGFIAEDVLEVMKDYVYVPENYDETKFDNTEDENGNIDITQDVPSLDYSKFVVPLVKLCQMQQKQIDDLTSRIEKLENK